ncbi:MAG: hypothetical protein KBG83_00120 [Bacteroidetes bacterium]|nr:hypothetical protein [Bacteroidota bacterium]
MNNNFSILEEKFVAMEQQLIEEAAYGKGINSLPSNWDENRPRRIYQAEKDFFYFATEYFPQWFEFSFCDAHREMIKAAMSNDRIIHIFAAPRDFGKTRIFRVFKIWCACFGKKKLYSKSSDTIDLIRKDFRYVREILKYNPKIISDFGDIIDPNWDSLDSFRIVPHKYNPTGTTFVANSMTVTPRGELAETRIDFEEFDDFEDFSTSINPEISQRKIEIIERDYHLGLSDNGCGIYLGNNARTTCLINLLKEIPEKTRKMQHPAFELHIIDGWDEKHARPRWYQRYQAKSEDEFRKEMNLSVNVFNAEVRQKPAPPEGTRFLQKYWNTFKDVPKDATGIMFCDPAFGETSDFKTFVILLFSTSMKKFLVPDCFVRRCGWEEYFLGMYDAYERYRFHLYYIGWESNFAQAQYLEFRKIYISTKNKPDLPIRPIHVEGDKFFRIEQLETPYSLGNILFAENFLATRDGIEAQSQLIGYVGKKDSTHRVDFPDALASAYKEVWHLAMYHDSEFSPLEIGGNRRSAERW